MGDVVNFPIILDSELGRELVSACARYSEGLMDESTIRKKRPLVLGSPTTRLASRHSEQHLVYWALRSPPSRFIGPIAGRPCPALGDERKEGTSLPREPRLMRLRVNH
jgi:hypothetical protein